MDDSNFSKFTTILTFPEMKSIWGVDHKKFLESVERWKEVLKETDGNETKKLATRALQCSATLEKRFGFMKHYIKVYDSLENLNGEARISKRPYLSGMQEAFESLHIALNDYLKEFKFPPEPEKVHEKKEPATIRKKKKRYYAL